ncbi:hypothetical protein H4R18_004484 [Coemansia javaensis]|uniref:YMC020W-like alpha/beta hydrolase domain-containing protein n=1 Tax=Coemansia javaensis TaxID=2761396 RepID=A0A9W8HAN2_9FUNG|nr:hypothetical protein H4R18_004484 [Coemansia javaensis]
MGSNAPARPALGALGGDPQTASSPELMAGFMANLLDYDSRPRSWSAQSSRSLPRSTRSNIDSPPSRPAVARAFGGGSPRIEARGRVSTQAAPRGARPRSACEKRPGALGLMKPLASNDSAAGSSTQGRQSSAGSGSSTQGGQSAGSGSSARSVRSSIGRSDGACPQTQLALEVAVAPPKPEGGSGPAVSSIWSALSRLSVDTGARKAAVDHLKDIESKQRPPSPHVPAPSADSGGSRWRGWWPGASSQAPPPPPPPSSSSEATAAEPAAAIPAAAIPAANPEDSAAPQACAAPQAQAKSNILLPDFDPGSAGFPIHVPRAGEAAEAQSAREAADGDGESPIRKRLRTAGQMVLDSVAEMAPAWARSALWGQRVADVLGQTGGPATGAEPTADQTKELLDASAGRLGKIAIVGVHGWFPMRMLQMLAGEPTGKSEKFCSMMCDALKAHLLDSHGVAVADDDISLFPLVGEGRIEHRVELLLGQITDPGAAAAAVPAEALMPARDVRVQTLQGADTVFVVTHSQGTPVSAMLVERMLEMGLLDAARQRIGMLAMAGISHGPLAHLRDNVVIKYIESESTRELFELMDPSSFQSQRYVAALSTILHKGVRLVCVGSWTDEVVPLYSAILQGVSHPNVYRAVYIDAPHYLDDFLTNLIIFALRLRNMGIYDHDLLIHLSQVVAGSMWGQHWGHSTVYSEPAVYRLAIKWLLYSTSAALHAAAQASTSVPTDASRRAGVSGPQTHMSYRPFNARSPLNPFYIPWIMRTLWDEPAIRDNPGLCAELRRLIALFDEWEPKTKPGRDLKYRLEPVRAAL